MVKITLHGRNGSRVLELKPRGFSTRHIRTRVAPPPPAPKPETPKPEPKQDPPVPVCPVLAALHWLTTRYPSGSRYFILDEIFVTLRRECTSLSRDALLETLRTYYRDGQILFRQGYGSQLQFALPRRRKP